MRLNITFLRCITLSFFTLVLVSEFAIAGISKSNDVAPLTPVVQAPSKLPSLMSLQQALDLAVGVHPNIMMREADLLSSQADLQQATIDTRWRAAIHLDARAADLVNDDENLKNDSRANLTISKLLWDFGSSAAQEKAAKLDAQSAELGLLYAKRLQRIEIIRQFFSVLAADYQFAADNEAMSLAFFPFDRAQERHDRFDSVSELEVMEKRVVYLDELSKRNQTVREQRASRLMLALAMGRPDQKPIELIEPSLTSYAREIPDFDDMVKTILEAHPLIKRMELDIETLEAKASLIGESEKPSLRLELQATEYEQVHRLRDRKRASVALTIPIKTKKLYKAEHATLAAQIEAKRAQQLALSYDVRTQVLTWVHRLDWLAQRIEQNVLNFDYRERALDKNRLLYEMEVNAIIGQSQADMARLLWQDALAKFERAIIWEQIDAVMGAPLVDF